jgi:ATP-independent RNA helicase DbpA
MCPTRELANQVAVELRKLARHIHNVKILTLCGGVPFKPQEASLSHGAHIIVGTPGRILKHLKEKNLSFDDIDTLVLDEADRMLDMGFYEDINSIIEYIPKQRQTLLFSATFPDDIQELSAHILNDPISVSTTHKEEKVKIKQVFYEIESEDKAQVLVDVFNTYEPSSVVIFCNTKIACDKLSDELYDIGFDVLVLHSDLDQKERDETLILFANKSYPILIATDVAARGLDIDDIDLVVNYDIANEPAVHTHRIGRSARAGKSGVSVGLVNGEDYEKYKELKLEANEEFELLQCDTLKVDRKYMLDAPFRTMYINGGKKNKLRAGDILGALIQDIGLEKDDVGKINTFAFHTYVAIKKEVFEKAFEAIQTKKIKGKFFRIFKR